jgi:hypothetical protein
MEFTLKPSETPGGPPPMMTCPKCGFEQPENPDCAKCGIVIARYKPSQTAAPAYTPPPPEKSKAQMAIDRMKEVTPPPAGGALFSQLFRLARWAVVLGCLAALFMMFRQAPPPRVAVDPEGAQKVGDKFLAAQEAAKQGQSFAMLLTEAELNAWLQANLTSSGGTAPAGGGQPTQEQVQSSMKDIKLHLVGDQVHAYTLFTLYGKDVTLQLTGKLLVKDGRIRLDATEGMLGTLPLPKVTLGSATAGLFDSPANREKFTLPPHIANVQVQNGELVISYKGQTP